MKCVICNEHVDSAVPRELCPFCYTPIAKSFGWSNVVLPLAAGTLIAYTGFHLDQGSLVPTDLPHEPEHVAHSVNSGSTVALQGWGQFASIAQVTTAPSSGFAIRGDAVSPIFLQWPVRSN